MKKAIGYVQVAGGQNPELALEGQKKRISEYAEKNGYEVIGWEEDVCSGWTKVDNDLIPRAKEKAKILWCGTRWSMVDPAGIRMELLKNDSKFQNRRFEIMNLPALDENADLDRPALKRVLDRAKEGQFEAVLATKLDILARNDSLFQVIELLGDSGVVLDFVSDDGALLELHNAFRRLAGV